MYIGNECILTFEDPVCESFLKGDLKFEIVQSIEPVESRPNLFIQIPSVIQCINPSVNSESGKLKFSVQYKPSELYVLKSASIIFDRPIETYYEIRGRENVSNGSCSCSEVKLGYDSSLDMLYLNFEEKKAVDSPDISEYALVSETNRLLELEVSNMEKMISELQRENNELLLKKEELETRSENIKSEIEDLRTLKEDVSSLEIKKYKLSEDIRQNTENSENTDNLREQLAYFSDILRYYKSDDGYDTISERLESIRNEIDEIALHISQLAEKRSVVISLIDDELNI